MGDRDSVHDNPDRRTSERRSFAPPAAESSREPTAEDFLYHLYRGSELLQDNRVLEAKEELENALMLQPRDAKGQDLLAVVYFRIGHYARAIQIYEQLKISNPRDPALKLNLALCYLKTGQAALARTDLEDLVRSNPSHKRAWGYLGLAYERLDDFTKAEDAFERGGHTQMARRMGERRTASRAGIDIAALSQRFAPEHEGAQEAREAISMAFEELDAGELRFSLAAPAIGGGESGSWRTVELGATPPASTRPLGIEGASSPLSQRARPQREANGPISQRAVPEVRTTLAAPNTLPGVAPPADGQPVISARPAEAAAPPLLAQLVHATRASFPASWGVSLLPSGVALVQTAAPIDTAPERAFAIRLESIRSLGGALTTAVMERRNAKSGTSTGEAFGGVGSPVVRVSGDGQLVLGPRAAHVLVGFRIEEEPASFREELLLGFDLSLSFENGRLTTGEGDGAPVVHLRGTGVVLLELMGGVVSLDVSAARTVSVRRETILGWTGGITPRALPPSEAPCGQRGLVTFGGEGTILISAT